MWINTIILTQKIHNTVSVIYLEIFLKPQGFGNVCSNAILTEGRATTVKFTRIHDKDSLTCLTNMSFYMTKVKHIPLI